MAGLANAPLGTLVPADLTGTVCRGKPLEIAAADKLAGWGISFGRYETAQIANMALRGRVLSARDWVRDGAAGVVKMPGSVGFSAMVWSLDQQTSKALVRLSQAAECLLRCHDARELRAHFGDGDCRSQEQADDHARLRQGVDVAPPPKKKKKTARKRKK